MTLPTHNSAGHQAEVQCSSGNIERRIQYDLIPQLDPVTQGLKLPLGSPDSCYIDVTAGYDDVANEAGEIRVVYGCKTGAVLALTLNFGRARRTQYQDSLRCVGSGECFAVVGFPRETRLLEGRD